MANSAVEWLWSQISCCLLINSSNQRGGLSSAEDYHRAIGLGIRKVNYYSYMARAGVEGVKSLLAQKEVRYFYELSAAAKEAMAADVEKALALFANRREFL